MSQVSDGNEARPDGRIATAEIRRLRMATRALRYHLDELPVDYDLDMPGDRFLSSVAFMFARQRYDCAESMIGAGFGGTVLGAISRSLFVDGLRWLWIGRQPERRRTLLGDLLEERNRLCILLEKTEASCPILARWLMPLPQVPDLTGESLAWLDASAMPTEDQLIDSFLSEHQPADSRMADGDSALLRRARSLLDMTGLRGAVLILAHAGHGSHLGLQSSLTEDGVPGHDVRADHEALFMHVAAAGVTATLVGSGIAVPELWPQEVERGSYMQTAINLAAEVMSAAVAIHHLDTSRRPPAPVRTLSAPMRAGSLLRPCAVLSADYLLPDVNSADAVGAAAEDYYDVVRGSLIDPWNLEPPSLHVMLAYGGGLSNLQTVMSTYTEPGSGIISVFAARMLLEEAARVLWRFSVSDSEKFKARAKQYFDEYRARQRRTVDLLIGNGVAPADARRVFEKPRNVLTVTPDDEIAKGREPIPSITKMLKEMGAPYPEPGWLELAYSLLSQVTHSTPIGYLHTLRYKEDVLHGAELSPEMLALALDVACLGSSHLISISTLILTDLSDAARAYQQDLYNSAYAVHNAARMVHGLD